MKKHFCENDKCMFYNYLIDHDDYYILYRGDKKIKRYLNNVHDHGVKVGEIWLCESCTGAIELVIGLIDYSKLKEGVMN